MSPPTRRSGPRPGGRSIVEKVRTHYDTDSVDGRADISGRRHAEGTPSPASLPATPTLDAILERDAAWVDGYLLGFAAGRWVGFAQGENAEARLWSEAVGVIQADAGRPGHAELEQRRTTVDHAPCPARCRRCSRCTHSLAYWGRGGRDYLGAEAEAGMLVPSCVDGAA